MVTVAEFRARICSAGVGIAWQELEQSVNAKVLKDKERCFSVVKSRWTNP